MGRGSGDTAGPQGGPGGIRTLLAAWMLVNGLLLLPWWFAGGELGREWFALEAGVLVGIVALVPFRRWSRTVAVALATVVGASSVLILGDALARQSLARPLNFYLDLHLAPSVPHLLLGALGAVRGTLVLAGVVVVILGAVGLLGRLLARLARSGVLPGRGHDLSAGRGWTRWLAPGVAAALLLTSGAALAGLPVPVLGLGRGWAERPAWVVVDQQLRHLDRMMEARERFETEMAAGPGSYVDRPGLLRGLGGRDLILAFVESYGMTVLEDPRYASVLRPRLETLAERLEGAGLHAATGVLVSPTQGGQSWLAHASMLSGLWIADQLRYDLLLASGRETLVDDLRAAGYRAEALMPAITLAWPEGTRFGYDRIWARGDIDYRGPALNWVTMPDQFAWAFLQREIREPSQVPVFAEVGLISSHAPWTPVLPVLDDWDAIGDGAIFRRWEGTGEPPQELWRDPDRVRAQYPRSVEYAVHAALAWAERYVDDGALLILLGDHQPAPLITGEDGSRAVPVHVVAGSPALVRPFVEWGFAPGLLPPEDDDPRRMDAFRPWFVEAFSETGRPGPAVEETQEPRDPEPTR